MADSLETGSNNSLYDKKKKNFVIFLTFFFFLKLPQNGTLDNIIFPMGSFICHVREPIKGSNRYKDSVQFHLTIQLVRLPTFSFAPFHGNANVNPAYFLS